eukprot:6180445-Pleurochrysis_carterae.AAC.1
MLRKDRAEDKNNERRAEGEHSETSMQLGGTVHATSYSACSCSIWWIGLACSKGIAGGARECRDQGPKVAKCRRAGRAQGRGLGRRHAQQSACARPPLAPFADLTLPLS